MGEAWKMMAFSEAWDILKATRQTTLGEFHPDLPSPYGPVTMRRWHPTQEWGNQWLEGILHGKAIEQDFNPDEFQPYEDLIIEGLKPQAPTLESILWEHDHSDLGLEDDIKPFHLDENTLGNWFYPTGDLTGLSHVSRNHMKDGGLRNQIGVRMPIEQLQGQFRNLGYMNEAPEAHVINHIPPQYLVQLPDKFMGEGEATWGAKGE